VVPRPCREKEESSTDYLMLPRSQGIRLTTEELLTEYNKALRQAKRESWRRHCQEIEKTPECARLHKILSKGGLSAINSIQLENGEYTTEKGTLEELLRVHFPGSEIISEPSGGWNGLELEFPKWKGSRGDWAVSKRVIDYSKLKWAVFSFQPYKSPGIDGIMPIMLQQGFSLLVSKLLTSLRASMALGYIPMSWRHIRVVFISKPGKSMSQAKSLWPISLMLVILKTLEKLLDRHIGGGGGGGFCLKNHYTRTNLPTGRGCLQKQPSSRSYTDWKSL
jgi:hypothetical protein